MKTLKLHKRFQSNDLRGSIYCGDAIEFLASCQPDSADIVFLDPPFNLGKSYADSHPDLDSRSATDYLTWMEQVIQDAITVMKPGGALYLYHIPQWAVQLAPLLSKHLTFRHWIAVSMKNGFARGERLYPAHYALLYYTKGAPAVFKRPKLRPITCPHCKKLFKSYGGYTRIIQEKGINLSDVWEDLSPVRHKSTKQRNANELPLRLTDRIVEISGVRGGLLVDPFAGTGTALLAAARHGLRFRASDLIRENCVIMSNRLADWRTAHTQRETE